MNIHTHWAEVGSGKLAVAGKHVRTGNTTIELWTFSYPDPAPAPYVDITTGEKLYPSIHLAIAEREVLYDSAESGRLLVRAMFPRRGGDPALLVLFDDSREVYRLDVESRDLALLLSPSADEGVPQLAALANDYVNRWGGDHDTLGYVYFFSPNFDRSLEILALFDHDRDGELDEYRTVPRNEFHELGLSAGVRYIEYF